MCTYVEAPSVLPGYGCCGCHCYNGLQRDVCRVCEKKPCAIEIPPTVARCAECGFGYRQAEDQFTVCPVCRTPLVGRTITLTPRGKVAAEIHIRDHARFAELCREAGGMPTDDELLDAEHSRLFGEERTRRIREGLPVQPISEVASGDLRNRS